MPEAKDALYNRAGDIIRQIAEYLNFSGMPQEISINIKSQDILADDFYIFMDMAKEEDYYSCTLTLEKR